MGGSAELSEDVLQQVEFRKQIREHILSGRVSNATDLIIDHFPSVLSTDQFDTSQPTSRGMEYIASTSVDPLHLSLNLRILSFIEACRTRPLEYPPRDTNTEGDAPESFNHWRTVPSLQALYDPESLQRQSELIFRAQMLYRAANRIPKPSDRAAYFKELATITGLLVYKVPEKSSASRYLSQERREAVADQIDRAILYVTGLPPTAVPYLELYTRLMSRPPGVQLPPNKVANPSFKAHTVPLRGCP